MPTTLQTLQCSVLENGNNAVTEISYAGNMGAFENTEVTPTRKSGYTY